jgi:hypothetical protein
MEIINKRLKKRKGRKNALPLTRDLASGGLTFSAEISYRYSRPNAKPPGRYLQAIDSAVQFLSDKKLKYKTL